MAKIKRDMLLRSPHWLIPPRLVSPLHS